MGKTILRSDNFLEGRLSAMLGSEPRAIFIVIQAAYNLITDDGQPTGTYLHNTGTIVFAGHYSLLRC
jgi:hypothetical protein